MGLHCHITAGYFKVTPERWRKQIRTLIYCNLNRIKQHFCKFFVFVQLIRHRVMKDVSEKTVSALDTVPVREGSRVFITAVLSSSRGE